MWSCRTLKDTLIVKPQSLSIMRTYVILLVADFMWTESWFSGTTRRVLCYNCPIRKGKVLSRRKPVPVRQLCGVVKVSRCISFALRSKPEVKLHHSFLCFNLHLLTCCNFITGIWTDSNTNEIDICIIVYFQMLLSFMVNHEMFDIRLSKKVWQL